MFRFPKGMGLHQWDLVTADEVQDVVLLDRARSMSATDGVRVGLSHCVD